MLMQISVRAARLRNNLGLTKLLSHQTRTPSASKELLMHSVFYLIGVIVVVLAIVGLLF